MKKRIKKKIQKRFEELDELLVWCFAHGRANYWKEIATFRAVIQYLKGRWPEIYARTFRMTRQEGLNLGHMMAGRRD